MRTRLVSGVAVPLRMCLKCRVLKALGDFYSDKSRKDGIHPYCKACKIAAACVWGKANRDLTIEYTRTYKKKHRVQIRVANREYNAKNKQKIDARSLLNVAVKAGKIKKSKVCERCGKPGRLHGHHADYSKPLEVEWLCPTCHMSHHAAEGTS